MQGRCTFIFAGPRVDLVGITKLPYGQIPVLLHNGEITLQTQSGKLASIALDTHAYLFIDAIEGKSQKEVRVHFHTVYSNINLHKN